MTFEIKGWDFLSALGFAQESKPIGGMPTLPTDVTELDDKRLMSLFSQLTEWTCYAAAQLAGARRDQREVHAYVRVASARAMAAVTGERTVAGRKAAAAADPGLQTAEADLDEATDLVEALEMVHENARSRAQFLSRELSRRIASRDLDNRSNKWGV